MASGPGVTSSSEWRSGNVRRVEKTHVFLAYVADENVIGFLCEDKIEVRILDRHVGSDAARPEYWHFIVVDGHAFAEIGLVDIGNAYPGRVAYPHRTAV